MPFVHIGMIVILTLAVVVLLAVNKVHDRQVPDRKDGRRGPKPARRRSLSMPESSAVGRLRAEHTNGAQTQPDQRAGGTVVTCESLTKRYGDILAVDEVSFGLEAGTVTGFLGPNGAGKTTTLKLLLGLAEPTSGEALVLGRRYRDLDHPIRRVGAVLESADFHPSRSGRDHLRAMALAADLPLGRVEEVLELVELGAAARRRVRGYSLGMRQRLGLAAALLGDPELLILDEPANGLDPAGVRWLRTFLRGLAAQGRTVLVSSHLLAEVAQTVDHVVIIDHGRLLADGPLDELGRDGQTLEDVYLELTEGESR
jgi:ABC-2 type transport system ATP-binding protein